jgi:hypothetical protein
LNLHKYIIILAGLLTFSCKQFNRNQSHKEISNASITEGESLAKKYCQSCHALPDPSLLDEKSWETGVLPNMGPRLGIFNHNWTIYPSMRRDINVPAGFYPSRPLMTDEEWQHIIDYYTATAPDKMPKQQRQNPILNDLNIFKVISPAITGSDPTTCFLLVDTTLFPHTLLQSDIFRKSVIRYNKELQPVDSFSTSGPVVDIDFHSGTLIATNIGQLDPTNAKKGKLQSVRINKQGKMVLDSTRFIGSLQRPVQSIRVDLNGDGKPDELICEFGHLTGALSWYENTDTGYIRHVLRPVPGAIKAYVRDYNKDGLPDLLVLFAQGEEGIFLFTNLGKGKFEEKEILRFPPSYGSSYFELDDFNHDGYPDIVYTCGDNADFSQVLKPYHGVYIFLNDGNWNFTQKYFFPINGCYKAMAGDFDGDGDLDLAVISFFADYQNQPEEGFVYLENIGDFHFMPHSLLEASNGRWLTMDIGDLDGDGKPDIFLGNFSVAPGFINTFIPWKKAPAYLFLKNISR